MEIYIQKKNEAKHFTPEKLVDIRLIGFYALLYKMDCNKRYLTKDFEKYGLDIFEVRSYLEKLQTSKLLQYSLSEDTDIVISIEFSQAKAELVSAKIESIDIFADVFGLEPGVFNKIYRAAVIDDLFDEEFFLLSLHKKLGSFLIPQSKTDNFVLNDKNDLFNYLQTVYPQEMIVNANGKLSNSNIDFLIKCIYKYSFSRDIINMIIDYTITSNEYHNFNQNFALKLAFNWHKKGFTSLDECYDYIKISKNNISSKNNDSKYQAPTWEVVDDEKMETLSAEELKKLLEFNNG